MIAIVPTVVTVVGALLWRFTAGRLNEAGKIIFSVGLFFLVSAYAGDSVKVLLHR